MNNQNKKNKMPRFNLNWLYIAIIAGLVFMLFQGKDSIGGVNKEVNLTQFRATFRMAMPRVWSSTKPMERRVSR